MNAQMRIYVRVINMAQAQLGALDSQVARTEGRLNAASAASGRFHGSLATNRLTSWGKNLQWAGRQIEYNFTLPLVIAGAAAVHWSNQNEEAATKLKKVYGDASPAFQQLSATEIPALRRAFVQLSNIMGVSQAEILDMAATWAQAGVSGLALAKYTRMTAEAMILGEMSAQEASKALIQISAQYKLSADQLKDALGIMNAVENQTAASMNDLIVAFTKTAFLAQETGIDVRHLAAMVAAITPAAGTGAQAGQALKTVIQSIIKPTQGAIEVMQAIGIQFNSAGWQSKSMTDRLQELSDKFKPLTANQKVYTASIIVGKYQANRFVALLDSMADKQGNYARALQVTSDMQKVHNIYAQELGTVLKSQPRAFDILKERIKNSMTEAIFPLIPALISVIAMFSKLAEAFGNMNPATQKLIVVLLLLVAVVGPLLRYMGAFALLIGELGKGLLWLSARFMFFGTIVTATGVRIGFLSRIFYYLRLAALASAAGLARLFGMSTAAAFLTGRMNALRSSTLGVALAQTVLGSAASTAAAFFVRGMGIMGRGVAVLYEVVYSGFVTMMVGAVRRFAVMAVGWVEVAFARIYAVVIGSRIYQAAVVAMTPLVTLFSTLGTRLVDIWILAWGRIRNTSWGYALVMQRDLAWLRNVYTNITGAIAASAVAIWRALGVALVTVQGIIGSALVTAQTAIAGALTAVWGALQSALVLITEAGAAVVARVYVALTVTLPELLMRVGMAMQAIWTAANAGLAAISAFFGKTMTTFMQAWSQVFLEIWLALGRGVAAVWAAAQALWATITAAGQTVITAITEFFATRVMTVYNFMARNVTAIWTRMWAWLVAATRGGAILTAMNGMWGGIRSMFIRGWAALRAINISGLFASTVGIWGLAIIAVVALIVRFRKQVAKVFGDIRDVVLKAFYALPNGIQKAFLAVIRVIANAVKAVRQWMGELSPFKRHSPSTVDHVREGSKVITKHYKKMGKQSAEGVSQGADAVQNFKNVTAGAQAQMEAGDTAKLREQVVAAAPQAGPAFDQTTAAIRNLQAKLPAMEAAIARQKTVVDQWKNALDAADKALDGAQKKLDGLQKIADKAEEKLTASKDALDKWAQTPIVGMKAMDDQIFSNNLAAQKLQLQILKLEDAGKGPDALADKFSKLQGDIDSLRGEATNLRQMGAGSDVLGPINAQINAMDKQANSIAQQQKSVGGLQEAYDKLQRQGQIMDLEKSIKFDPLTKQIQDFTNTSKEMPFDTIMAGLRSSQAAVNANQAAFDTATAAVDRQKAVVDQLTAARDALSERYDAENDKLTKMNDAYQANVDKINEMKDALSQFAQAADAAKSAKDKDPSAALQGLETAGLGSPDDAAGGDNFQLGREGGMGDQSAAIDAMADQWKKESEAAFKGLDMFGPFKDMWNSFIKWVDKNTGGLGTRIVNGIKHNLVGALAGAGLGALIAGPLGAAVGFGIGALLQAAPWTKIADAISKFFGDNKTGQKMWGGLAASGRFISDFFGTIAGWASDLWKLFGPDIIKLFDSLGNSIAKVFGGIGQALGRINWKNLIDAFHNIWIVAKPILGLLILPLIAGFKIFGAILANTIGPIFDLFTQRIMFFINIGVDLLNFVTAILTGQWGDAWQAIKDIFADTWDAITGTLGSVAAILWGAVKGIVEGIVGFFKWLYDVLVGHSIVPDLVNAIVSIFQWFGSIIGPIVQAAVTVITTVFNGIGWVVSNVIIPALQFLASVFTTVFGTIGQIVWTVWSTYIKVVFDIISWVVRNVLIPVIQFLAKIWWDVFSTIGKIAWTVWSTYIKVVFDIISWVVRNTIIPIVQLMGKVFASVWNAIGSVVSWIWNHVIQPAWSGLKWYWDNQLHPAIDTMGRVFGAVWNGIGGAISWVVNNVIKPALQSIINFWNGPLKSTLNALLRGFASIFNNVGKAVAWGVGVAVDAINAIVKGIDWLADKLHLGFKIEPFGKPGAPFWNPPQFARGGPLPTSEVGGGFMVNRARAIVGEGNPNYPEFVIPTDPRYRSRAQDLHKMAGQRLGAIGPEEYASGGSLKAHLGHSKYGVKAYIGGGLLDTLAGKADGIIDGIKTGAGYIRKGAVTAAFAPFLAAFDAANKLTPNEPVPLHDTANKVKNDVYNWAKGNDKDYGPNWELNVPAGFGSWAEWYMAQAGDLGGPAYDGTGNAWVSGKGLKGVNLEFFNRVTRMAEAFHRHINVNSGFRSIAEQRVLYARYMSGNGPVAAVPGSSKHEKGLAMDINPGRSVFGGRAGSFGLKFPVPSEDWHVEPSTGVGPAKYNGGGPAGETIPGSPRAIARALLGRFGWGLDQFPPLDKLWTKESGWNPLIANRSSGAYGIPQALPGSKMASAGSDWRTNPATQIKWGLGYIGDRYGSPAAAWAHSQRYNWYARGGILPSQMRMGGVIPMSSVFRAANGALINPTQDGTLIRAGEGGQREAVVPLPNDLRLGEGKGDIHFHGDLNFPNVRDGNDARAFIDNLRLLAKK